MGDRWSFPKQNSAATYIWQPLQIDGPEISIPAFNEAWSINLPTGTVSTTVLQGVEMKAEDKQIIYSGNWQSGYINGKKLQYERRFIFFFR